MSQKVLLEVAFLCADHIALLRSLIEAGMVSATPPDEVGIHGPRLKEVPPDWVTVDFHGKTLTAYWNDGSYVSVSGPDLVFVSTRNYQLDVNDLAARLANVEFEAANFCEIRWWDNPKGPAYKSPDGKVGTYRLGFAVAYRGKGHDRAMSRRWLDRGPWRVLRGANDTTFPQFHDESADVVTSLEQAKPCHAQMSDRAQAPLPLREAYAAGAVPVQGTDLALERKYKLSVAGRRVSRLEMREVVAARYYQLLGPDRPIDNVLYTFMDKAELEEVLPDLWLYGLEAQYRDAAGLHRMDDSYVPPPYEKPDWVKRLSTSVMHIEAPFRLVYTFGDEFVPTHRYGRVVAQLFEDGRMFVDNVFRGAFTKSFEGVTERATIERILAHLDEGGFPAVERHRILPGATLRVIVVQSGTAEAHNLPIEWSAGQKMKGYGDAFKLLDSMIAELAEGAITMVGAPSSGLVRKADAPSRPAIPLDEAYELGFAPALVLMASEQATAAERRRNVERILEKYGRSVPSEAVKADKWAQEAYWAAEMIVSGLSAEAFALGRAVGQVQLALEEGKAPRMPRAIALLQLSRHAPAREIAELALAPSPDSRARLETLATALRQAIGI